MNFIIRLLQWFKNYFGAKRYRKRVAGFDDSWGDWTRSKMGPYTCFEYEYQTSTRGWLILKRVSKLLAPFLVTLVFNLLLPLQVFNNLVFWFWEVIAVALIVAPIGTNAYPLMFKSCRKHVQRFIEWVTGN